MATPEFPHPWKGKNQIGIRHEPTTAVRIIRDFFDIIDTDPRSMRVIARDAGSHNVTLSNWRHGRTAPSLTAFEAVCQTLGYQLELRPIISEQTSSERLHALAAISGPDGDAARRELAKRARRIKANRRRSPA
jgi:transcriptional regulator with XRE-family HTH domain